MTKRKSFGIIKNTNNGWKQGEISLTKDLSYEMGRYGLRPVTPYEQCTTVLYLEVVIALGEEELVKSVYEISEYDVVRDRWQQCTLPYVSPFCIRIESFVGFQQDLWRRAHPNAKVIHAEYFVDYVA